MTNCPMFIKIQKMFHGKFVTIVEAQPVAKTQIITTDYWKQLENKQEMKASRFMKWNNCIN